MNFKQACYVLTASLLLASPSLVEAQTGTPEEVYERPASRFVV